MNKRLLILMAALFLGGAALAQEPAYVRAHDNNMPVVAQVVLDETPVTATDGWTLKAYIGNDQRGEADIRTDLDLGNTYWIQVYYDTDTEDNTPVTFTISDGTDEYTSETTLNTDPEGYGTPGTPQVLEFAAMQSQTIALASGWNWFSTNVDVSLAELQAALVQALGTGNEITINARSGDISYYNGIRWRGELSSLDITQMYLLETPNACEITLSGARVNPVAYEITITPGFNWISFLCNEEMDITTAFSSLAISGDMVVSDNGQSSTYTGTRWRGDLTVLEPGKGYIYESASGENRSFYYPANSRVGDGSNIANRYDTHWSDFNPNAYRFNLPVVAFVQIDGNYITSDDNPDALEVAAFVDGECRGHKFMIDETNLGDPYPYVSVPVYYTNTNEPVNFILYNHITGVEYVECVSSIEILTGVKHTELYTNYDDAVVLNFASPTAGPYTLDITGHHGSAGGYYLISSPVTEEITPSTENGFITDAFDLYYFDQNGDGEGNEWINYNPNTFNIVSKKGYLYASQEDTELQFAGTACTDGVVPLEYSTATNISENMRGWNLIGNPLAQAAAIDRACYVMQGAAELTPVPARTVIPAMNGVFVKATESGQSATFTPGSGSGDGRIVLNMLKDRGAAIDRAIVSLGEGSILPKFMLNPNNTKIYIEQDGDDYAVVSSNEDVIPVSFKAASNGTYTLNVAVQNAEMDYLHLIDNIAGMDVDLLANPNYTFEANTHDYACRFTLVMSSTTGIEEQFAFFNGHNWAVNNDGEALLQVIDMMGHVLTSKEICGNAEINIQAARGVYMFRLVNGSDVKVQKVVVR